MGFKGLNTVLRTSWVEAAASTEKRLMQNLIEADEPYQEPFGPVIQRDWIHGEGHWGRATQDAQKLWWHRSVDADGRTSSRFHPRKSCTTSLWVQIRIGQKTADAKCGDSGCGIRRRHCAFSLQSKNGKPHQGCRSTSGTSSRRKPFCLRWRFAYSPVARATGMSAKER